MVPARVCARLLPLAFGGLVGWAAQVGAAAPPLDLPQALPWATDEAGAPAVEAQVEFRTADPSNRREVQLYLRYLRRAPPQAVQHDAQERLGETAFTWGDLLGNDLRRDLYRVVAQSAAYRPEGEVTTYELQGLTGAPWRRLQAQVDATSHKIVELNFYAASSGTAARSLICGPGQSPDALGECILLAGAGQDASASHLEWFVAKTRSAPPELRPSRLWHLGECNDALLFRWRRQLLDRTAPPAKPAK